jgi:hypothetical protein
VTAHYTHTRGQSLEVAEEHIADLVARSCQEERDAGAVYGDAVEGFLRWLSEQLPMTSAG